MPIFRYTAISHDGQPAAGELEAADVQAAIDQVLALHAEVQSIHIVASKVAAAPMVANEEDGLLQRQLQRLVEQRAVIVPALEAYAAELSRGPERSELQSMLGQMQQPQAAADIGQALTPLWVRLVSASFRSPTASYLVRVLDRRHQSAEVTDRTVARVLVYPAAVFFSSIVVFVMFAYLVAPTFREIFLSFDTVLPPLTRLVLRITETVTSIGWYWYVLIALLAVVSVWWITKVRGRKGTDPVSDITTFTEALADLVEGRVPVPAAVRLASRATAAPWLQNQARQLSLQLAQGYVTGSHFNTAHREGEAPAEPSFAELPARQEPRPPSFETASHPPAAIPRSVIYALAGTDAPVTTARLLRELAGVFQMTRRQRSRWVLAFLEPMAIVAVGLVVGLVVISVFLPLLSLITNLSY